jgi:hypothetical protein
VGVRWLTRPLDDLRWDRRRSRPQCLPWSDARDALPAGCAGIQCGYLSHHLRTIGREWFRAWKVYMTGELRVRLSGENAELGSVFAIDVAHLLEGVERAVGRAAEQVVGRTPGLTGRRGKDIESATRFRLLSIEPGSVQSVLVLPALQAEGPLGLDVETLGEQALELALSTLEGTTAMPTVADALAGIGESIGLGSRYDSVSLRHERNGRSKTVILDRDATRRLRLAAQATVDESVDLVIGTLVEADFERMSARLRTPDNTQIRVQFDNALADAIQEGLRHQAGFEGLVSYEEATGRATGIELRSVTRTEQLLIGVDESEFWRERTVEELASDQGITPATSAGDLYDGDATESEIDAFFEALEL